MPFIPACSMRRCATIRKGSVHLNDLADRRQLVPIVHNTTYEALREVSPLLASRNGLSTAKEPMEDVAAKIVELVAP
jgi:hypothetical protein